MDLSDVLTKIASLLKKDKQAKGEQKMHRKTTSGRYIPLCIYVLSAISVVVILYVALISRVSIYWWLLIPEAALRSPALVFVYKHNAKYAMFFFGFKVVVDILTTIFDTSILHHIPKTEVFVTVLDFISLVLAYFLATSPKVTTLNLQHGQASVFYDATSSPLDVCHYHVIHGPAHYPQHGHLPKASQWFYRFSFSHPWNLIAQYPKDPHVISVQEERVSVRLSTFATTDIRRLFLEIFIFYKIVDVKLLVQTQSDPIDALRYYAKEDLMRKIQNYSYKEFMQNRQELRQRDFSQVYRGLVNYAYKIGVAITDTYCVDYVTSPKSWKLKKFSSRNAAKPGETKADDEETSEKERYIDQIQENEALDEAKRQREEWEKKKQERKIKQMEEEEKEEQRKKDEKDDLDFSQMI